ncbi:hypothetical protein B0A49_01848 [Cryomyces minteri]|uniref:N-acetyltransferase domain-containing protein n=1 Tax=Cryomyces minteri TaxID=331657 RepID=A0A4U0XKZ4_9PEZI|nr:hypothetical protein B0A49_01848 [Cryomyces minteri]
MTFTLSPASKPDAEALVECGASAFRDDKLDNITFPTHLKDSQNPNESHAWRAARTIDRMSGAGAHFLKVVDDDNGKAVGFAGWYAPGSGKERVGDEPQYPKSMDVEVHKEYVTKIQEMRKKILGERKDYWCV